MKNELSNLDNYSLSELSSTEAEQIEGGSWFYWAAYGVGRFVGGLMLAMSGTTS